MKKEIVLTKLNDEKERVERRIYFWHRLQSYSLPPLLIHFLRIFIQDTGKSLSNLDNNDSDIFPS